MKLPGNSRQIVRDAVRAALKTAPDTQQTETALEILAGRKINDLPNQDLTAIAELLGINVFAVVASVCSPSFNPNTPRPAPGPFPGTVYVNPDRATTTQEDTTDMDMGETGTTPGTRDDTQTEIDVSLASPETEALNLRRELATAMVEGDFDNLTARLTRLIQDARKIPDTVTVEVEVERVVYRDGTEPASPAPGATPVPVPVPGHAATSTWGKTFGITDRAMSGRALNIYAPHQTTPEIDAKYQWPKPTTAAALCAMARNRNVWLYGPAGTGKSTFGEQLAARTGRPFFLIACDDTTEAPELLGMTVPHAGGVRWQDGILTAAIRVPHAVILVDEPTVARPGALMVLQSVLQSRMLSIKETGELVKVAPGVRFLVADNTNGTGGGAAEGYEGTRRLNRATLDRFASFLRVTYMEPDAEAAALVAHTSCQPALAKMLVECAGMTRKAKVTHALGLRRLIAWAEALTDGLPPRVAFEIAILNACAKDDREPTEQCCALGLDKRAVAQALSGLAPSPGTDPAPASPRQSRAAADFAE